MSENSTQQFEIGNNLNDISDVVIQIVGMGEHLFQNVYMLEVAVYEAICNAIEHGNLEISKKEKERLLGRESYDKFLASMCSSDKFLNKKVKIKSTVDDKSQTIEIEDEGKGFDWRKEMRKVIAEQNKFPSRFNGYGIRIIAAVFNVLEYNEKGNILKLVKFTDKIKQEDNAG